LKTEVTKEDFRELAVTRHGTYNFLTSIYIQPSAEDLAAKLTEKTLNAVPFSPAITQAASRDMEEGFRMLRQYMADSYSRPIKELAEELAVERTRLLRGLKRGYGPPPPYESVYMDAEAIQTYISGVSKLYEEAGVSLSKELKERPDYIGIELDFMRLMCSREAEAWKHGNAGDARSALQLERRMLKEHLVAWVPKFCDIAFEEARNGFYRAVLKVTKELVLSETAMIDDLIDTASFE
jgi:TorA maturation chaperone TorD